MRTREKSDQAQVNLRPVHLVYTDEMEPSATCPPIPAAAAMDKPVPELQDFDEVVRVYWPRVFRFTLATSRDRDVAETVTQECFLRAYRGRDSFRGESSLQSWLMQIAINLVRDFTRSRRLQFWKRAQFSALDLESASDWIPDSGLSPEAKAVMREQVTAVWRASTKLSERQRTVFLLRFVEEMALTEIAAATGMQIGTVKVHLFRALQSVRERMGETK
ncbi:MAG TPA: sigma-70 family RNA polymerase sigma factor [Bryobacteraceae bacterium]|nr:sigma-70 family RNA polymerase sigma factor [Bryobacteraceae bacterium]